MSKTVISVRNLGKKYRLGATLSPDTLRDHIMQAASRLFSRGNGGMYRARNDDFWALKDVSFDVQQGDILGVIGPNGAGKSTLLKILTGITEPTEGRVWLKGRVASLLEVGTGFHQELTGRENIYMNGAILGMTKAEINAKFDEIVAFAGVEKFLDTPVKRYSSGMRVRLGFAVAAHLEPEILLVDEVLSVGDAAFQKKCLGKMENVAKIGRTILFVSHNLAAVKTLCGRALWMDNGYTGLDGSPAEVVATYLASLSSSAGVEIEERIDRTGNGRFQFTRVQFVNKRGQKVSQITSGDELTLQLDYNTKDRVDEKRMIIIVSFRDDEDRAVVTFCSDEMGATFAPFQRMGTVELSIPHFWIRGGHYDISLFARNGTDSDADLYDRVYHAASLDVIAGDIWKSGRTNRPGPCALIPASIHNIKTT